MYDKHTLVTMAKFQPDKCHTLVLSLLEQPLLMQDLHAGQRFSVITLQRELKHIPRPFLNKGIQSLLALGVLVPNPGSTLKLAVILIVLPFEVFEKILIELSTSINRKDGASRRGSTGAINADQHGLTQFNDLIIDIALQHCEPLTERRKLLADSLVSIMQQLPFNSFAAVNYACGEPIKLQEGGNCALHSKQLAKHLDALFPNAKFKCILGQDQLHTVVLAQFDDEAYLLDSTSILPAQALLIPSQSKGKSIMGNHLWHPSSRRSIIILERLHQNDIKLSNFIPKRVGFECRAHVFTTNSQNIIMDDLIHDLSYVKRATLQDQVLVFRICSPGKGVFTFFNSLETGQAYFIAPNSRRTRVFKGMRNDAEFSQFLQMIGMSQQALARYQATSCSRLDA